jgi:putative FmdB family regulatory protein
MPTYDYACASCGHEFEAFHSMTATLTECPECHKDSLRRRIGTGAGLIFKGTGFYQTDYKPSPKASADTGSSSSSKSAESKAADKPAAEAKSTT